MKISGKELSKIIKEEVTKVLESKDAERVAQAVSKSSEFEARIAAINTQEELEELLQFVVSKLDPSKIDATRLKRALKAMHSKL